MKGYKAFEADLSCRGYQFTEGETHIHEGVVILCSSGFHFCTLLQDVVNYYHEPNMRVFEIEASGTISDAEDDCSKRACSEIRLVKELSLDEVRASITKSKHAYYWGIEIGDKELMRQFITDSHYAYNWARDIGDTEHMKQFITDSKYAYYWARDIGDKECMKQFINNAGYAYEWVKYVNPKDKQYFVDKGLLV